MTRLKNILFLIIPIIGSSQLSFADILDSTPVGPGIIYHHEFRAAGPWHIQVLEIDLSNNWIKLETIKANDQLVGRETTSSMAARSDRESHRVVGTINADFFSSDGIPVGAQIIDGMLLKRPTSRSVFGITDLKGPLIDIVSFKGTIRTRKNTSRGIDGVNEARETDKLIVYNKFMSSRTNTNYWGTEIIIRYITHHPIVNDTVYAVAVAKDSIMAGGHGNNVIPTDGVIISGHGTSSTFLNENVFVGDTLALILQLPPVKEPIAALIGGTPRLIRNGVATVEWSNEGTGQSFAYDRHPRTAVGFSQDSTKLFLFAVDGRQPGYSVGMSLFELANYMLEWQVYQGINLDGGGSTTMVVRGKVVNNPSDATGERPVANALMVISTAATGPVSILKIAPKKLFVLSENQLQFSVAGFDQYYNPVEVKTDSLHWSCDSNIGSIGQNGLFTAGNYLDSGYVYVSYGYIRDSARVYITTVASIELTPNPIILKVGETQKVIPKAVDSSNNIIALSPTDYQWSVSGDIGTISNDGVFTAVLPGQGFVIASYQAVSGSASVTVGVTSDIILDDFRDVSNWTPTGVRVNLAECNFTADNSVLLSPPSSGKLEYSLATGGTSALYLSCSIPISGTPEAIGVHVYGDGKGHWLRGEFDDADGEKFLINFTESTPGIDWINSWKYLKIPFKNAIIHWNNPSAILTFPITWKKIYLAETDEGKKNSGIIYFDDFTAHFIATSVKDHRGFAIPSSYLLEQNYPNPFNSITQITFDLPGDAQVKLEIYNIRGQVISTLLDQKMDTGEYVMNFDASHLSSGVYLYRINTENFQETKKMLVIK